LPTEAEWEYACRAGAASSQPFHFGPSLSSRQANFDGNCPSGEAEGPYLERTCPVGSYAPNAWGLFDMHGNVFEWCQDWYDGDYYDSSPRKDPKGPSTGKLSSLIPTHPANVQDHRRVLRGGSWCSVAGSCRAACRSKGKPRNSGDNVGFRVALSLA
jgi:formylglycine-generating enzyme required for sulfatase activity